MVTTSEIHFAGKLGLIEPPRHIHVHARRAVLVVGGTIFQGRNLSRQIAADGIHQIATDLAAAIAQAVLKSVALRIEQNASGLAPAGSQYDHPGFSAHLLARFFVYVENTI